MNTTTMAPHATAPLDLNGPVPDTSHQSTPPATAPQGASQCAHVDIQKCLHPAERSRFWLAIGIVLPVTLLYILLTQGIGLFIVPVILAAAWATTRLFRAQLLGSCAAVSPDNFPEVHALLEEIRTGLAYPHKVEAYVYQGDGVNAFLVKRFRTRIILLPHDLLEDMQDEPGRLELMWVLARAVGHLKAKHLRLWWIKLLIESFERLFVFNLFLYPWERAIQYSGDRIGLTVCADLGAALGAMNKFMLGNALAKKTTLVGALQQREQLSGSFFGWLAESTSTHPHLTKRIASLVSWSRIENPAVYERFMQQQPARQHIESLL